MKRHISLVCFSFSTGFLCIIFLFISSKSLAQDSYWQCVYQNYTTNDGLPSMESYWAVQDNDGYMWYATDRGVARFNGKEFKIFTTDDGLESNVVFKVVLDDKGRIWFLSDAGRLCYFQDGRIHSYKFNNLLDSHFKQKTIASYSSWSFENDEVMLSTNLDLPVKIDSKGKLSIYSPPENIDLSSVRSVVYEFDNKIVGSGELINEVNDYFAICFRDIQTNIQIEPSNGYPLFGKLSKDKRFIAKGKNFVIQNKEKITNVEFTNDIYIAAFIDNRLWIGFREHGVKRFRIENDILVEELHLFRDKSITSVVKNDLGHYWFTSIYSGIFQVPNLGVSKLVGKPELNETVISLAVIGDNLVFTKAGEKEIHFFDLKSKEMVDIKELPTEYYKVSIAAIPFTEDVIISCDLPSHLRERISRVRDEKYGITYENGIVSSARKLNDEEYVLANGRNILVGINSFLIPFWSQNIELAGDNRLWVSNYGKLKLMDLNTGKITSPKNSLLDQRVNDVLSVADYTFFGTNGSGLIVKDKSAINQIDGADGLQLKYIDKIKSGPDASVWLLGSDGIVRLTKNSEYQNYSQFYGAKSFNCEYLNDVYSSKDYTYLATNKGIVRIENNDKVKARIIPKLHLKAVNINGEDRRIEDMTLPYNYNNLIVTHDAVSFENNGVSYRYRYHQKDKWIVVKEAMIRLNSLPPGDYKFEIQASSNGRDWTKSEGFNFTILKPFWLTWWFILLEIILGAIIIIWLIGKRLRTIEMRHADKEKMMQLQQEALTQQMNPHFIFNALGSVQNSILKGDSKQANSYLVKFSRLLRSGLNASRSHLITLEEDKELMENYLAVEKTRLGENFTYSVEVKSSSKPYSLYTSPFLLQTFLENSIQHGIGEEHKCGCVTVIYEEMEDCIQCTIEDNGIGRDAANMKKSPNHISHGSDIAFERIELFNKSRGRLCVKLTKDLFDEKGSSSGTKVIFTLPIIKK